MTSRATWPTLALTLGLALGACGGDDSEGGGGGSAGGTPDAGDQDVNQNGDVVNDNATPDVVDQDVAPDVQHEAGPCTDVTSVSGSVVDESDAPFNDANVILCITKEGGNALCLNPEETDASGQFSIDMPGGSACLEGAAFQAKSFADLTLVGLYCPVDVSAGGAVTVADPVKLVTAPACTRDPLNADTTQPHTVTSPGGATMTVVPEELWLFDYTYEDMRLVTWDSATWGWPCFIDASSPPDGLVAFAPEVEVKSEDALHVSFPNDAGLAPGTAVDLYALGGAATQDWNDEMVHEGHWQLIGEAVVSSDGARIETQPGEGLPFGTWVGWKQK